MGRSGSSVAQANSAKVKINSGGEFDGFRRVGGGGGLRLDVGLDRACFRAIEVDSPHRPSEAAR